jgi:hypothetical protein
MVNTPFHKYLEGPKRKAQGSVKNKKTHGASPERTAQEKKY